MPPLDPSEHLHLAGALQEHCRTESIRDLSSAMASYSATSPSFSLTSLSLQPSDDATSHQATYAPVHNLRSHAKWAFDSQPVMASREAQSVWRGEDPLNGMWSPSASSLSAGQSSAYTPASNLYAIWKPLSETSDHAQKIGSQKPSSAPLPPHLAMSSPLMVSAPTPTPINAWTPEDHLQQSTLAANEKLGHQKSSSGPGSSAAGAGDSLGRRYASYRSRGGSDTIALADELHVNQPPRTRRARLGTEATPDAQPNSEGAKAEESRQLSR